MRLASYAMLIGASNDPANMDYTYLWCATTYDDHSNEAQPIHHEVRRCPLVEWLHIRPADAPGSLLWVLVPQFSQIPYMNPFFFFFLSFCGWDPAPGATELQFIPQFLEVPITSGDYQRDSACLGASTGKSGWSSISTCQVWFWSFDGSDCAAT